MQTPSAAQHVMRMNLAADPLTPLSDPTRATRKTAAAPYVAVQEGKRGRARRRARAPEGGGRRRGATAEFLLDVGQCRRLVSSSRGCLTQTISKRTCDEEMVPLYQ